jgi:HD-GYP domain-containing protein (c-di-GMP phosphodiesterase class II)
MRAEDTTGVFPRLAELLGALSLATDLAAGLGYETALRTALIAVRLGERLGLRGAVLRDVYYTGLLRFLGCTAFAHEMAQVGGGDDMALLQALTPVDAAQPLATLRTIVTRVGRNGPPLRRATAVAHVLSDPRLAQKIAVAHCALAVALAARLGMSQAVTAALGQIYERFDGKGAPQSLHGSALLPNARVMHVAFRAEAHRSLFGTAEAVAAVRARSGGELDPQIATVFAQHGRALLEDVSTASVWELFLAAEPGPALRLAPERTATVALAFAQYTDAKSPWTLGHSTGVAELADAAAVRSGMASDARTTLQVAALLHDLGRISVPNGIWDKPAPLNPLEWERVRRHPYETERILGQTPLFAAVARVAAAHHERLDGSGYHRGLAGSQLDVAARLLAVCDVYRAQLEPRPYRAARQPAAAAAELTRLAQAGALDRAAVELVLGAAGQAASQRVRGAPPAALSDREAEVLCLVARGLSTKQIAATLVLSPRTVQHHIEHIYAKTGVQTRAAAAVFAVQNALLERWAI